MTSASLDRPDNSRQRGREQSLAVFALLTAAVSLLMPAGSAWWLAPGLFSGVAAVTAITRLVHRRGRELGRAWLRELAVALAIFGAAWILVLIMFDGPQHRLGSWSLALTAVFVGLLGLFTLGTAVQTRRDDGAGEPGPGPDVDAAPRWAGAITVVGGLLALALLTVVALR